MAVLNTRQCDGCGKLAEDGDVRGWLVLGVLAPLDADNEGNEPEENSLHGDFHSPACLRNTLDKVAPKKTRGGKKT